MYPRKSYIIYATPRSGSTLLCEALRNTKIAGKPAEYFTPVHALQYAEKWGISLRDQQAFLGDAYLQGVYTAGTTSNGIFGVKILWPLFPYCMYQLGKLEGNELLSVPQRLAAVFPQHQAIIMTRRDKVRQAISLWKATQTDQWQRWSGESNLARKQPAFHFQSIENFRQDLIDDEQEMHLYLDAMNIQPFTVVYEDFVDTYEETALRILDYLHIPAPKDLVFGERVLEKQSDDLTEEWVRQYYQMKQEQEKPSPALQANLT